MDFQWSETEETVASLARKILEDQATNERLKELAADGEAFDDQLWQALADANLLGAAVPEEFGGAGLGFLALCRLLEEVGRTVAPVPAYAALVLGALPVARFGSAAQKQAWLPRIASGEQIVTAALVELGSSDPLVPATGAETQGDRVRLIGSKTAVPFGMLASHILVPARFGDGSVAVFVVEPGSTGVTLTPQVTSDGLPHAQLELDGASVARDERIGERGQGKAVLRWLVERAVAARCMMQLGVTERALEMTAAYTRERVQFERPIGSFQAVHQRAADAYIHVEAIRLSAWEAAWRLSEELPAADAVRIAKFWAAEGGQFASYACQHLHGGIGLDTDYPLHRYFVWAIQIEHELGNAKQQLETIGREIAARGLPEA